MKEKIKNHKKGIIVTSVVIVLVIAAAVLLYMFRWNFVDAGKVADAKITESEIIKQYDNIKRTEYIDSDEKWASYLRSNSLTSESWRDKTLNNLVDEKVLEKLCKDAGVEISQKEVNDFYSAEVSRYPSADQFQQSMTAAGFTEETYKHRVKLNFMTEALVRKYCDEGKCDKYAEDYYINADNNGTLKMDGVIGYYMIAFSNEEAANAYMAKIQNGETTIEEVSHEAGANDATKTNTDMECFTFKGAIADELLNIISSMQMREVKCTVNNGTYYLISPVEVVHSAEPFTGWASLTDQSVVPKLVKFYAMSQTEVAAKIIKGAEENGEISIEKYDMRDDVPYNVDIDLGKNN